MVEGVIMSKIKKLVKKKIIKITSVLINWYLDDNKKSYKLNESNYNLLMDHRLHISRQKNIINDAFKKMLEYDMDWSNPQSFNQKIMWLKLNYQNPLIIQCCDKFAVKEYVSNIIGKEYVVPVIDWWTNPDDIDFSKLPDSFVIKVNWSSGFNIIVPNKKDINEEEIRSKLHTWMNPSSNSYYTLFNWGYKYVTPIIYAEKYISEIGDSTQIYDYKFHCFDGICKAICITTDRFINKTSNWFDANFNELPFMYGNYPKTNGGAKKPKYFEKMKLIAEKLSKPFPYVRVDFYETADKVYVGEMTFYSGGGMRKFTPRESDFEMGKLINLPKPMYFDDYMWLEKLEPKQAYYLENKISLDEKLRYCENKAMSTLLYFPNLKNPKSFNEKLIWLALYYKNPLISTLTDKYELKEYLKEKIGKEYVIPSIGCYTDPNDIIWDDLPNRFVIKSTAGRASKQIKVVINKQYENESVLKMNCSNWIYPWNSYYYENMCITEQKIKPRILIEELLDDGNLIEYNFYASFDEVIMTIIVNNHKHSHTFVNPYTWEVYPTVRPGYNIDKNVQKPKKLKKMLEIASILSKEFPLVRIDFYEVGNRIYVGEISFDPGLFTRFVPTSFDFKIGKFIDLKKIDKSNIKE